MLGTGFCKAIYIGERSLDSEAVKRGVYGLCLVFEKQEQAHTEGTKKNEN